MNIEAKTREILAQTWSVAPDEIPANAALGTYRPWDSLGHVGVMMALSAEFGFELNADRVQELTTLPAICEFVQAEVSSDAEQVL